MGAIEANGDHLGRYRIRGVLGEGGMGRLYLAEQRGIEGFAKIVALKRILPHLAHSPHLRRLFLTEARVAARLEHPNIVATYELGETDGTYFIAMEYLPGEDLRAILSRCRAGARMPVDIAAAVALQSASGLHHAHELRDGGGRHVGIVHRDVNPSNIFITYYGMVKLLDFGVAKGPSGGVKTNPGLFKGKYAYCAPEQVMSEPVDRRTDVFCLGIVLWECLTGRRLFDGTTDVTTIEAVRRSEIPVPSNLRPDVPPELDAIVERALTRDRNHRYQSARQMAEDLELYLARRHERTSPRGLADWLERLFGHERAALKLAMAHGEDVEHALARLRELTVEERREGTGSSATLSGLRPRTLWSTELEPMAAQATDGLPAWMMPPKTTVKPAAPARSSTLRLLGGSDGVKLIVAVASAAAVVTMGIALVKRQPPRPAAVLAASASLAVDSDPAGAHVLVDGNPTGLVTPTVLRGLRVGREVDLRLDRPGYAPVSRRVKIVAGEERQTFTLSESTGVLRFDGLPGGARVYLDDVAVDARQPVTAPVGQRVLRIEVADELWAERQVEVRPGDQTVRLNGKRVVR